MAKLFSLPGVPKGEDGKPIAGAKAPFPLKGEFTIMNTVFKDGKALFSNEDAPKKIALVRFYGCTVENVADPEEAELGGDGDPSLAATETK